MTAPRAEDGDSRPSSMNFQTTRSRTRRLDRANGTASSAPPARRLTRSVNRASISTSWFCHRSRTSLLASFSRTRARSRAVASRRKAFSRAAGFTLGVLLWYMASPEANTASKMHAFTPEDLALIAVRALWRTSRASSVTAVSGPTVTCASWTLVATRLRLIQRASHLARNATRRGPAGLVLLTSSWPIPSTAKSSALRRSRWSRASSELRRRKASFCYYCGNPKALVVCFARPELAAR